MFTIQCDIRYVDGTEWHGSLASWAEAPSEGIDLIAVGGGQFSGDSIYYCQEQNVAPQGQPEEMAYVVGSYAPYHKTKYAEVVYCRDKEISRWCYFPPDLRLHEVKLGWWRTEDG